MILICYKILVQIRITTFLFVCIISPFYNLFASEWQKKHSYESVRENFEEPPAWYAPHTFWFWDAPLDPDVTAAMAKEMIRQKLNPGYAHPRHSGDPSNVYPSLPVEEWLSPLWFKSFDSALREAESAGMTLGYCDEYWWPSGQAAGRVLKTNPDLKATSLKWVRKEITGPGDYTVPASKFSIAGRLSKNDLLLSKTVHLIGEGPSFSWKVPDGKWVVYSYDQYHHPGVDGGKVNYLDPQLMDIFIPIAHESYQKHFEERLGNSIPGVFIDNEGDFGWKMAWSEYFAKRYRALKNRDIRITLPLLTEKDEDGLWAKLRFDWFDVVSEVYSNTFLGRLSDWLAERNMYYISNLWEESLMLQTRAVGDFMRAQRSVTLPGNDCLQMKSQQVHDFKETQSVCEFEDRPFMSELMGVAGWEQTPIQMKKTINAVTAWGVTHNVPHGINLNRKLETIPYPADWYTENPYWRYLHLWTDFARRAAFVNRQGRLCADILLLNPLESVWALSEGYFTSEDGNVWPEKVIEINDTYTNTMEILTKSRLDYLIVDSHYMKNAAIVKEIDRNLTTLQIKNHLFSGLILPPLFILSRSTSQKILEFAQKGGKIFVLGDLPTGSPEKGANDPLIHKQMKQLIQLPNVRNLSSQTDKIKRLPQEIMDVTEPQVQLISSDLPLLISHRIIGNNHFYWCANNTDKEELCTLSFRDGRGRAEIWDCENGQKTPIIYKETKQKKHIRLHFKPYQAFWLVFDGKEIPIKNQIEKSGKTRTISITQPWYMSFPERDTIHVSSARFKIAENLDLQSEFLSPDFDDSDWSWQNIVGPVRLTDHWQASLLFNPEPNSRRFYRFSFKLKTKPEKGLININADNRAKFWVNGKLMTPGNHANSWANPDLHDITADLQKEENVIAVEVQNNAGYGWLIVQGGIQMMDGETYQIFSGKNWRESNQLSQGWTDLDYDDSSWKFAQLADLTTEKENINRMQNPQIAVLSKNSVWWRMNIPPGAKEGILPGISKTTNVWVDGKKREVFNQKIRLPIHSKMMVINLLPGEKGLSAPAQYLCEKPGQMELKSWLDFGLRQYTGFADYETNFTLPQKSQNIRMDLGDVLHMAEVWVNNMKVGERLWPPYIFNISEAIKEGKNTVKIRVGNLMVNEMGLKADLGQLRHWGWQGTPPDSCFDAGLFGPVKLMYSPE